MPVRPKNLRPLRANDFRRIRFYLADEVFFQAPGGGVPPNDPIDEEAWDSAIDLPTDVLLRTTDYQGSVFQDCHERWADWVHATPEEPSESAFMFEPAIDSGDEFHAAPFIAAHGWYRQGTAGLRNAIESMAHASAFAIGDDVARYAEWRSGSFEPKFGNAVDLLGLDADLTALDKKFGGGGLFGHNPDGVMRDLYGHLCRYAHSHAGHTNADIWQSNGPVWIGNAFRDFWIDFCDTYILCFVLLRIGWSSVKLPDDVRPLFGAASPRWHGLAEAVERVFFPK